jgi:hypothetical protein
MVSFPLPRSVFTSLRASKAAMIASTAAGGGSPAL